MKHYNSQMTFNIKTQKLGQLRSIRFNNLSHKWKVIIKKHNKQYKGVLLT